MRKGIEKAGKIIAGAIMAAAVLFCTVAVATAGQAFAATSFYANKPVIEASFVEGSLAIGANDSTGQMTWSVSGNWAQEFAATVSVKKITAVGEQSIEPWRLVGGFNLTDRIVLPQVGGSIWLPPATPNSRPSFDITVIDPQPNETFLVRVQTLTENTVLYQSSGVDTVNAIQSTALHNPVP